jgi:ABC-type branched-subunit amino acid transport system permease subunit
MNTLAFTLIIVLGALIGAVCFFVFKYLKQKKTKDIIIAISLAVIGIVVNLLLNNGVIDSLFR